MLIQLSHSLVIDDSLISSIEVEEPYLLQEDDSIHLRTPVKVTMQNGTNYTSNTLVFAYPFLAKQHWQLTCYLIDLSRATIAGKENLLNEEEREILFDK